MTLAQEEGARLSWIAGSVAYLLCDLGQVTCTRRGWHTSGLSEALRGCEPAGRGLPSSPQGGGP